MLSTPTAYRKIREIKIVHLIAGGSIACESLVAAEAPGWFNAVAAAEPKFGNIERRLQIPLHGISYVENREIAE